MSENLVPNPSFNEDEFYENQRKPWWFYRCTHRDHAYWVDPEGQEYGCWRVLREVEHVAVLMQTCLPRVHLLVDVEGLGSVCKAMLLEQYEAMTEPQVMALVQSQVHHLRSIL